LSFIHHSPEAGVDDSETMIQSKRTPRNNLQRSSIATNLTSRTRKVKPSFPINELPLPPFFRAGSQNDQCPAKKLQRRHSSEPAMNIITEQRQVQHSSMNTRLVKNDEEEVVQQLHRGFRIDYKLGESIRSPSHMVNEPTSEGALRAVGSLQTHDFAFVKRSNGTYSYAILADRSVQPVKKGSSKQNNIEECIIVVLDGTGSTKLISKRRWSELVRVLSLRD